MMQGVAQDAGGNLTETPVGASPSSPGGYRPVYVRARTVLSNVLAKVAFSWPFNGSSPATTSLSDQVEGTAEQVAWRYVDADGIVWEPKAWWLVQIEWFKDGAPTPVTPALIAKYRKAADVIRDWPTQDVITGAPYTGIFPGEPTKAYPAYPPAAS